MAAQKDTVAALVRELEPLKNAPGGSAVYRRVRLTIRRHVEAAFVASLEDAGKARKATDLLFKRVDQLFFRKKAKAGGASSRQGMC
jgi:hypothetical protein